MADKEQAGSPEPDSPVHPGVTLRAAREERGVSVEEVSNDLRIEKRLLIALEEGDYGALGAPVFAKGYIRQYAARLGLDGAVLVEQYTAVAGPADVPVAPTRAIRLRDQRQVARWVIAALALALVAVFLLVWWLNGPGGASGRGLTSQRSPAAVPFPDTPGVVAAEPGGSAAPVGVGSAGQPATGRQQIAGGPLESPETAPETTTAGGDATLTAPGEAPAIVAAADSEQSAGVAPATGAGEAGAVGGQQSAVVASGGTESPGDLVVEVTFTDECWTEITDARGTRLYFGLATAGEQRVLRGVAPFDVFLGNADAAALTVGGREFTVPAASRRGNLARFSLAASAD